MQIYFIHLFTLTHYTDILSHMYITYTHTYTYTLQFLRVHPLTGLDQYMGVLGFWTQDLVKFWLVEEYSFSNERLDFQQIIILDVTNFFDYTVFYALFVTVSPVGDTMYGHPYTGQWSGLWMPRVELDSC